MRKISSLILFVILALIFVAGLVFAESQYPFKLLGADFGRWDFNKKLFYAEGKIKLEFDDLLLSGDVLIWDMNKQELHLQGNTVMQQNDQVIRGESLVYNTDTSQGELVQGAAELTAEKIEGPIFVFSDSIRIDGDNYHLHSGRLSTCDQSQPHYYLTVKSIHVYPGNKLIMHNVIFYEFGLPLFYWPYLVIPLDDRYDNVDFSLPEIGYDYTDGSYYIKNRYNYYFSEIAHGSILFDYYTRRGLGLGVDHNYVHSLIGTGKFFIYGFPFAENKDITAYVDHQYSYAVPHLNLKTNNKYLWKDDDGVVSQSGSGYVSAVYQQENLRASGSLNYDMAQEGDNERAVTWSAAAGWNQKLAPNWQLNASSNTKTTKEQQRTIDHLVETNYHIKNHTFNLALQQKYNPDILDADKKAVWTSINRVPEFTWQWQNPGYKDQVLRGRFELSIGNFTEYPSGTNSIRVLPRLELYSQSWRSDFGTTISYSGGAAGYFYQSNQSQQLIHGCINLSQKLSNKIYLSAVYNKRFVWGDSPFKFDKQSPQDKLTGSITYTKQPLTISLRTGYNFLEQEFDSLNPRVTINNSQGLISSLSASYDLNNKKFSTLTGRFDYSPYEDLVIGLGGTYNINSDRLTKYDGKISFDLTEKIKLNYNVMYDVSKASKFSKGELVVVVDLHCRKLKFTYNHVKPEFKIQYSINAFPKLPIGYGSEGFSFFEMKDLQEVIGLE